MSRRHQRIGRSHTFVSHPRVDIRATADESVRVPHGTLYRRGEVTQCWWDTHGVETWHAPDAEQARREYLAMQERWADAEEREARRKADQIDGYNRDDLGESPDR
jgi:hypothetical protein